MKSTHQSHYSGLDSNRGHNIVIFGEPGVGKSSVINMLSGRDVACTTSTCLSSAHKTKTGEPISLSCRTQSHGIRIDEQPFRMHEVSAFSADGRLPTTLDIAYAFTLMKQLESGVSLLVFCMRAPRITAGSTSNWNLFHDIFCQRQVPIVALITGLENEPRMKDWYDINKNHFHKNDMYPKAAACITAIRGKVDTSGKHVFQEEYDTSLSDIRHLIKSSYSKTPWRMGRVEWFNHYVPKVVDVRILWWSITKYEVHKKRKGAVHDLVVRCGMSKDEAKQLAEMLDKLQSAK